MVTDEKDLAATGVMGAGCSSFCRKAEEEADEAKYIEIVWACVWSRFIRKKLQKKKDDKHIKLRMLHMCDEMRDMNEQLM